MRGMEVDLDRLLNPAAVFNHPADVVDDPELSKHEKRAILSAWASDACAVQCLPGMRVLPDSKSLVTFDDIIDALNSLDEEPQASRPGGASARSRFPWWRRRRRRGDEGPSGVPLY